MKKNIIMQNKIFLWLVVATMLILLVPFLAMQFDWRLPDPGDSDLDTINWTISDFIVMGTLIFGTGFLFIHVARVTPRKYRALLGIAFAVLFLWIWAELAVGVFTNLGS